VVFRLKALPIKLHKTSIGSGTVFRNQGSSGPKLWKTASILNLNPLHTSCWRPNNTSPRWTYFAVVWAVGGQNGQWWVARTPLVGQKRAVRGAKREVGGRNSWREKTGGGVSRTQCCSFYGAIHLDHFYNGIDLA
jgi:hypothetical protein